MKRKSEQALEAMLETATREGLPAREAWIEPLVAVLGLLERFNARTNLVGDARPELVCAEHFLETLVLVGLRERLGGPAPNRIVDVGAGAGLEALLLALCWPEAQLIAVEPRRRRAAFIEVAADAAGVGSRLRVVARDLNNAALRGGFDLATSRAVFAPKRWLSLARPLISEGGLVALHLTSEASTEPLLEGGWREEAIQQVLGRSTHHVALLAFQ